MIDISNKFIIIASYDSLGDMRGNETLDIDVIRICVIFM
jgi:hypothetical protein